MIPRQAMPTLRKLARGFPVVAITGPRQSGKTTLAQATFPGKPYVSLEDPDQLARAAEDPRGFLNSYPKGAVIDEIQRLPQLFSYLQTQVDEQKKPGLFVVTGSQQFGLISSITQSLAGRVGLVQLLPFSLAELQIGIRHRYSLAEMLYRGFYPPLYDRPLDPAQWYANYAMTYIERDVRLLLYVQDLSHFQRFLRMCAARVGQLLNLSALASDCGISHNTAAKWLSVLEASYIVILLHPHFRSFNKRLVKSPKLYFYDVGLAAWLLQIQDPGHLSIHPQRGSLFENLVVAELLKKRFNAALPANIFFWRDNRGDEIDVIIDRGTRLYPVEIKSGETVPGDFMKGLEKWFKWSGEKDPSGYLVYGGNEHYQRGKVVIVPWQKAAKILPV